MEEVLRVRRIQVRHDTQSATLNQLLGEIKDFHQVVTTQSRVIHIQMEVIQEYSHQIKEMKEWL